MNAKSPRRPKSHAQHASISQAIPPSDYDSDLNYLSDMPAPPLERTDDELNLSVLRRHYHEIAALEYVAPYAVVYLFSAASAQWEKSGIEGTVFVSRLVPTPRHPERHAITVLNRRGLDNFHFELHGTADVELTEEYIILQAAEAAAATTTAAANDDDDDDDDEANRDDPAPRVHGLWIFSEAPPSSTAHHREAIARTIQECAARVEQAERAVREEERAATSAQAGRQLSLKELFGRQREQDDAWSVKSHRLPDPESQSPALPRGGRAPRAGLSHAELLPGASPTTARGQARESRAQEALVLPDRPPEVVAQQQILMDLFKKAGQGYKSVA